MKKLVALFLVCALCLGLAACESQEEKAAKQAMTDADALMESGDYASALEAYAALGEYEDAAAKVQEAELKLDEQKYGAYFGTWKNLYNDSVLTLEALGQSTLDGAACTYAIGTNLTITGLEADITLEITDHNGTPRLINREESLDFVPEAAYEDFAPVTVEITMENWDTYFELREMSNFSYTYLICPETGVPDFEVWMKPEYVYKLVDTPADDTMELNVVFTFAYDAGAYKFKTDSNGEHTFTFYDELPANMSDMVPAPRECPLKDYRSWGMILNDTQCPVSAWGGWYSGYGSDSDGTVVYPINPSVTSVQGTITLLP